MLLLIEGQEHEETLPKVKVTHSLIVLGPVVARVPLYLGHSKERWNSSRKGSKRNNFIMRSKFFPSGSDPITHAYEKGDSHESGRFSSLGRINNMTF